MPIDRRFLRRRGGNHTPSSVTFQIDAGLLKAVREAVSEGEALTPNAFVEDALRMKIREVRRAKLEANYQQASQDSEFLADLEATTRAFETTVGDGLAYIPE